MNCCWIAFLLIITILQVVTGHPAPPRIQGLGSRPSPYRDQDNYHQDSPRKGESCQGAECRPVKGGCEDCQVTVPLTAGMNAFIKDWDK